MSGAFAFPVSTVRSSIRVLERFIAKYPNDASRHLLSVELKRLRAKLESEEASVLLAKPVLRARDTVTRICEAAAREPGDA